jgi:hypothetical protein
MPDFNLYKGYYSDFEISIHANDTKTYVKCSKEELENLKKQIDERLEE